MKRICSLIILTMLLSIALIGCAGSGKYKDGAYTGTGKGLKGDIEVSVNVKRGKITAIDITKKDETGPLIDSVRDNLIPDIIKKQTTEGVDTVSGATGSSKGVLAAVNDALAKAKK
jgi:uncharacterized protein with FMN-binding domain